MNQSLVKFSAAILIAAVIYLVNINFKPASEPGGLADMQIELKANDANTSTFGLKSDFTEQQPRTTSDDPDLNPLGDGEKESEGGFEQAASGGTQQADRVSDRPINTLRDFNNAFVDLAKSTSPAVVTVFTRQTIRQRVPRSLFDEFFGFDPFSRPGQRQQQPPQEREFRRDGQGSGFIVSEEGYVITNNHVVHNADSVFVRTHDNRELAAEVIGTDPTTDIAILRIQARNLPVLRLGNSDAVQIGEWVMAVGSPLSERLAHSVTKGIVSAKGRSINLQPLTIEDFIQTDAAINPGNSGGPLVNIDGEVIGINTAIASRSGGFQGIGFAIPSNIARRVMESIVETGRVVRAYLGVTGANLDQTMAQGFGLETSRGALIYEVMEGSPADEAGLKEGDIILELDGQTVQSFDQLRANIAAKAPGTSMRMKVKRNGDTMNIDVTLSEMPDELIAADVDTDQESRLGFSVKEFSREDAGRYGLNTGLNGVLVTEVNPESEAYARGLREGDLIIAVNRRAVRNVQEFNQIVGNIAAGDVALLQAVRQNSRMFISFRVSD